MIEDWMDLIEATAYKCSFNGREPIRDRYEFSLACEAYIEAVEKFDPSKSPMGDQGFGAFLCLSIRRKIFSWRRAEYGRKGQKILNFVPLHSHSKHEVNKDTVMVDLDDLLRHLTKDEYRAVAIVYLTGKKPKNNKTYRKWRQAVEKLKEVG